eukprot:5290584-Prymnesium_polylepis.1
MSKTQQVRGGWSGPVLSNEQKAYAAMDATYSLKVYHKLSEKPDVTVRMSAEQAQPDVLVDLVPRHGSAAVMATRAAAARVVATSGVWQNRLGRRMRRKDDSVIKVTPTTRRLIEVTEVYAPSFLVPG